MDDSSAVSWAARPPASAGRGALDWSGRQAVKALYCLFVLSIPLETVFYYLEDPGQAGSSVSLARMLGVALIGLGLVQWRLCFRRVPLSFWLIACYFAANAFTQLWIPDAAMRRFHEQQMTLLQMSCLFLISVNLLSDRGFRAVVFRLFAWWLAAVALGMLGGAFGAGLDSENRASIVTQDPNVTAGLFTVGALCLAGDRSLFEARRARLPLLLVSLGGVAVLVTAVLQTGSRGGLISLCAGFLGLAVCGAKRTGRTGLLTAALGLLVLGGLVRHEFQKGTTTAARLERSWSGGDVAGRTEIYAAAWQMFRERPLLGYGAANNRLVLGARLNYPERDTHNTFLAVLTEVSALGGAFFLAALLGAVAASWRAGRRTGDAIPFALMCALLVLNTSITGSREKIFWIALAAAFASAARPEAGGEDAA